jgi:hypothetical protein
MQKQQLQEAVNRRLNEIAENIEEGDMLRVKAAEDFEAQKQADARKKAAALAAVLETQKANDYLHEIKEREIKRNIRESARIAEYARVKEETLEKIKARKQELFDHKQAIKQRMIDRQAEAMKLRQAQQEQQLSQQVADKEADETRKFEKKQAKMEAWNKQLDASRMQQLHRKRAEEEAQKAADATAMEIQQQLFARLEKDERDEINERKAASIRLAKEQLKQIDMHKERKRRETQGEMEVVHRAKQAILHDLTDFHDYAEHVIKEYAIDGKNVIPLIKELRNYKKRLNE